jgi:hypothetical protein
MGYQEAPLIGCHCIECDAARAMAERPRTYCVPIEPEQPAEPVYTLVLIDCYDDGGMMGDSAEPHTAESLIEAIISRRDREGRFKVYKLGEMVLDVVEVE